MEPDDKSPLSRTPGFVDMEASVHLQGRPFPIPLRDYLDDIRNGDSAYGIYKVRGSSYRVEIMTITWGRFFLFVRGPDFALMEKETKALQDRMAGSVAGEETTKEVCDFVRALGEPAALLEARSKEA